MDERAVRRAYAAQCVTGFAPRPAQDRLARVLDAGRRKRARAGVLVGRGLHYFDALFRRRRPIPRGGIALPAISFAAPIKYNNFGILGSFWGILGSWVHFSCSEPY